MSEQKIEKYKIVISQKYQLDRIFINANCFSLFLPLHADFHHLQVIAELLFMACVWAEANASMNSPLSQADYSIIRLIMGAFIGFIYLSAIITRLQTILLSLCVCGLLITAAYLFAQRTIAWEILCATLVLIYSLIVLQLSHSNWIFRLQIAQGKSQPILAVNHTAELKPLVYLTGAKLLTVFCYFLPFFHYAARAFNERQATNANRLSTTTTIALLIVLLLARLALGIITIVLHQKYLHRFTVNYLMLINSALFTTLFVAVVPITSLTRHQIVITDTVQAYLLSMCIVYVTISMIVDVFETATVTVNHYTNVISAATQCISLTFATFIEHLMDVSFIVVYINDWLSAKIVLTVIGIVCVSMTIEKYRILLPMRTRNIETYRIL